MNVNIKLSISDEDRDKLANYLDRKETKRLATRAEIRELVNGLFNVTLMSAERWNPEVEEATTERANEPYIYDGPPPDAKLGVPRGTSVEQVKQQACTEQAHEGRHTHTVASLVRILSELDQHRVVVLQRDPEGNGYGLMYDFWYGAMDSSGNVGLDELDETAKLSGYNEEDLVQGTPVLVLTPGT